MKDTTYKLIYRMAKHRRKQADFYTQAWADRCFDKADTLPSQHRGLFLFICGIYGE